MKKLSNKRKVIEREYKKVLKEILEERGRCCEGCECVKPLTPSHRIARSRNINLLAVKRNIDLYCDTCHNNYERGRMWELKNKKDVYEFLKEHDPELYTKKMNKSKVSLIFLDKWSCNIDTISQRLNEVGLKMDYVYGLEAEGLIFKMPNVSQIHYQRLV